MCYITVMSCVEPLIPSSVYHIYSHPNGNEQIFREEENYNYFLQKYAEHIHPIAETFAYCLMPNHFHLMVRVRDEEILMETLSLEQSGDLVSTLSKKFSNFLNAYAKAYNKRFDRRGSLFERPFKRKPVKSDDYFTALIAYIHNNPVYHGFVSDPIDWPHWFGGKAVL